MKVHIFYNGGDYKIPLPQDDVWGNYENINNPRLFLACVYSWQRRGFEVIRLTSLGLKNPFDFKGVLARDLHLYPLMNWNIWPAILEKVEKFPALVVNMNVFNYHWSPKNIMANWRHCEVSPVGALALHQNGWSASCMIVSREFCRTVVKTLCEIDWHGIVGGMPQYPFYIDDFFVRDILSGLIKKHPCCGFPFIYTPANNFPLQHFARSITARSLETIPTL